MKDNILKKEFKKKDVERLRNLVKGKGGERTGQGVGYTKKQEFYKEGDIWEENGRTWTIRDGVKQNITKLDKFKKAADCTAKKQTKLKLEGKWQDHKKEVHNKEIDKLIEEYKAFMKMKMNESNNGFVTESGEVEKWIGGIDKERAEEALKEGIKYLESMKKE